MSRRHTSTPPTRRLVGALVAALSMTLLVTAALPAAVSAQKGRDELNLQYEWQLLTYRATGPGGDLEPVPAGIGATLLLYGGENVLGEAACSTYETTYDVVGKNLYIFPTEPVYVACDPAALEFDDVFYELLWDTTSYQLAGSMLVLKDEVGEQLMVFTRATIDDDPTVARWDLSRIGGADGSVEPVIMGLDPWVEFLPGGSVVGSMGTVCGSFVARYAINDGTMDITDVRHRLKQSCPSQSAIAQAEKVITTLDEIARFEVLPAGLRLQDENGTTRLAFTPVIELDARTWTPTVIYDADGNEVEEGNVLSTSAIQLLTDTANGGSICRPFNATGIRAGLALNVRNIKTIGKCKAPKNNDVDEPGVESAFFQALKQTASHALRGDELEFKDVDGRTLMRLEPQGELIGPTWVVDWLGRGRTEPIEGSERLTATFTEAGGTLGLMFGETGRGSNGYLADFETPQATRIDISRVEPDAECRGNKKNTPLCKQEEQFLTLLDQADRYRVRKEPEELVLLRGSDVIMRLEPEHLLTDEE